MSEFKISEDKKSIIVDGKIFVIDENRDKNKCVFKDGGICKLPREYRMCPNTKLGAYKRKRT